MPRCKRMLVEETTQATRRKFARPSFIPQKKNAGAFAPAFSPRFVLKETTQTSAGTFTLSCQECAPLRAWFTFSMFSTPLVFSHSSNAFAPCFA